LTHNILSFQYNEALPLLQELADRISNKIILSTIEMPKTAQQIALENGLPLSSTYKKIRKLQELDLLCIDKVYLEDGKKVLYYRSKIKSLEFFMKREGSMLQFERNENTCGLGKYPLRIL
jgi:hypothetical protein